MNAVEIREYQDIDKKDVVSLIAKFRQYLRSLKQIKKDLDLKEAQEELVYYLEKKYPIFVAIDETRCVGFIVCRVEDGIVWAESLFVDADKRLKRVGSSLFDRASKLAQEYQQDSLYVYVHPNNELMIRFLASKGYDVLNLIEVRKKYPNEEIHTTIQVGENHFKY